jgi:hypothetical protein
MTETTPAAVAVTPAPSEEQTQTAPNPAPEAETPDKTKEGTQPPAAATQEPGKPQAATEGDQTSSDSNEDKAKQNKVQPSERIKHYHDMYKEADARARAAEAKLARYEKPLPPPGPDASQDEIDQYNYRHVSRESAKEDISEELQAARAEVAQARFSTFSAKAEAAAERMPGLVEKFCALPVVSDQVADFVAESDKGAEVAYYLAENAAEATRLSRLPPYQQGVALARIEARLQAAPTVRKASTTPPPPPKLPGASSTIAKSPSEMSQAEYNEWYRKRGKAG